MVTSEQVDQWHDNIRETLIKKGVTGTPLRDLASLHNACTNAMGEFSKQGTKFTAIVIGIEQHEGFKLTGLLIKNFGTWAHFDIVEKSLCYTVKIDGFTYAQSLEIKQYAGGALAALRDINYELIERMNAFNNKGWDCDKSPDKHCHYHTEPDPKNKKFRVVELDNGELHRLPASHDPSQESSDHCVFCGEPSERK